jgi:WD40 repeat protein
MMTPRHVHHARLAALAIVAAMLGLLLAAVPAGAAGTGYGLSFSFSSPEGFEDPIGLAVDNSPDASNGDVYVVDQGHNALKKFSISGGTATQEWKVAIPEATLNQAAMVDDYAGPDEGDVYIVGEATNVVYQVNAAGTKVVEIEALKGVLGIKDVAVDAAGDFFVLSYGGVNARSVGEVLEYNSKWEPIDAAGLPVAAGENTVVTGLGERLTASAGPQTIAVSPSGEDIYVTVGAGDVYNRSSTGSYTVQATLVAGSYISTTFDPNPSEAVTVAPSGDVFVDQGFNDANVNLPGEVAWYEPSGKLLRTFGAGVLSGGGAYGVGAADDGDVYVADFGANQVDAFVEGPTSEVPVSEPASGVTSSGAVLHGEVNPHSETEVGWYFAYSTGANCSGGSETPAEGPAIVKARKVGAAVTGLEPNQKYTFCVVATDHFGAEPGSPLTFTTVAIPPAIEGESASDVKATEATLEGMVNPNNDPTECHFQYGRANVTENEVGCSQGVLTGLAGQGVSTTVTGLEPGTYKFRAIAKNKKGEEAIGPEKEFKKLVAPPEKPTTEEAQEITNATAVLHGVVNRASPSSVSWFFEYAAGASCTGAGVSTTPAQGPEEVQAHPAAVKITGLRPGTEYTVCLVAENEGKEKTAGNEVSFTTTAVPQAIDSESVSGVASTSATLEAQINPLWNETTYYFEYGETTGYEDPAVPAPPGLAVGSGEDDLGVSVHLQGLAAGTTYHYRVVANSVLHPEVVGPDRTFATQTTATAVTQPDGRVWELVSPPNKQGAGLFGIGHGTGVDIQAAADGGAITYVATAPIVAYPAGSRSVENEQVFSTRGAPGSWGTADITTAHHEGVTEIGTFLEYRLFSSDLSLGVVEPSGDTPLPPLPAGSEKTIYLREADGDYKALVTSENVQEGVKFGGNEENDVAVSFVSASPDFKHVVLKSTAALVAGAPSGGAVRDGGALYEWAGGQLRLVSVLPGNREAVEAKLGYEGSDAGGNVRGAISDDGSRIVWETLKEGKRHYYLRDMVKEETIEVGSGQQEGVEYDLANSEGSRIFVTNAGALDVFEVTSGAEEPLAGKTTELSGGVKGVIGVSEDGSYVYFVAGDSIYVDRYDEATKTWMSPALIAVLSAGDAPTWGYASTGQQESGHLENMTSRVSPNGRYLAFMSDASLTGYDNRDANSGAPDEEVFVYHAPEDPEQESGSLICASCDPTGARPVGVTEESGEQPLWDEGGLWQRRGVAGSVPGWTPISLSAARYQSRYLSNEGRLFFDSPDALVPGDVDGQVDVYEYEPAGVGGCQAPGYGQSASVVYSKGEGGCVGLVSSGTSSQESAFLDASETGGDVFFLTTSRLSPLDYDTSYDVYDAHECTTVVPCAPPPTLVPPPCTTGDACKAAPTPQPTFFGAPSSETFSGAGNIVLEATVPPKEIVKRKTARCVKGKKLSRGRCVRRKPVKHAKKSDRTRGGK